ncbi:MAG: hypothetical protein V1731_00450 [Candidatus Aenigmatarchaeota archaeon]
MKLTVYPRFWDSAKELLNLSSTYGHVIGEISGLETSDGIVAEQIHLPHKSGILAVNSSKEIYPNRNREGYEAVCAPHSCLLTDRYHQRMKGKNIIGYAGHCPILEPTVEDLDYARPYVSPRNSTAVLAFFDKNGNSAVYGITVRELSFFSQCNETQDNTPQSELAEFLEGAVLLRTPIKS